jgi:hypothetical protein
MWNSKNFSILTAAIFIGALYLLFLSAPQESADAEYIHSSERGGRWLLSYTAPFKDPGILWIIKVINDRFCQLPDLQDYVLEKFDREFQNHPIERGYKVLFVKDSGYARPSDEVLEPLTATYDHIIMPALYCDSEPVPQYALRTMSDVGLASGYDLAHKFLAMLFMKWNGCTTGEESAFLLARNKISESLDSRRVFSDLYAEEVAFLELAEVSLKEPWIDVIVGNQEESGAWSDVLFRGENLHTTALSVFAISSYTQSCPFGEVP